MLAAVSDLLQKSLQRTYNFSLAWHYGAKYNEYVNSLEQYEDPDEITDSTDSLESSFSFKLCFIVKGNIKSIILSILSNYRDCSTENELIITTNRYCELLWKESLFSLFFVRIPCIGRWKFLQKGFEYGHSIYLRRAMAHTYNSLRWSSANR